MLSILFIYITILNNQMTQNLKNGKKNDALKLLKRKNEKKIELQCQYDYVRKDLCLSGKRLEGYTKILIE